MTLSPLTNKKASALLLPLAIATVLLANLTASAQMLILPLGDSITDGFSVADGYRLELYNRLNGAGANFSFLGSQTDGASNTGGQFLPTAYQHHEGHSGYRADQIDGNLTGNTGTSGNNGGYWLSGGNGTGRTAIMPNIVLLHIGTNDFTQGASVATVNARLQSLLSDLKTDLPNSQIYVASLIPRTDNAALEAMQQQYNTLIPGDLTAVGSHFHFVDMHSVVTPAQVQGGNSGLHPNQAGYNAMGDAWFNAIVPEPSTPVLLVGAGLASLAFGAVKKHRRRFLVSAD